MAGEPNCGLTAKQASGKRVASMREKPRARSPEQLTAMLGKGRWTPAPGSILLVLALSKPRVPETLNVAKKAPVRSAVPVPEGRPPPQDQYTLVTPAEFVRSTELMIRLSPVSMVSAR